VDLDGSGHGQYKIFRILFAVSKENTKKTSELSMFRQRFEPYTSQELCRFFYLVCEAIGTAATPVLLCQPRVRVKMIVEKQMECRLAGETEVLGEYPSATVVHHKIPYDQTWV
jgi:hypothetical protein